MGTLVEREQGAFFTLGGFTRAARLEAEAKGKRKISLISGERLVDLILQHYDRLPGQYRELLGLKEAPLRNKFVVSEEASAP
jgi:restriction system protein